MKAEIPSTEDKFQVNQFGIIHRNLIVGAFTMLSPSVSVPMFVHVTSFPFSSRLILVQR